MRVEHHPDARTKSRLSSRSTASTGNTVLRSREDRGAGAVGGLVRPVKGAEWAPNGRGRIQQGLAEGRLVGARNTLTAMLDVHIRPRVEGHPGWGWGVGGATVGPGPLVVIGT